MILILIIKKTSEWERESCETKRQVNQQTRVRKKVEVLPIPQDLSNFTTHCELHNKERGKKNKEEEEKEEYGKKQRKNM